MSNPLYRTPTPYDGRIYSEEWHRWRDPEVPEWLDPVGWLLDRHLATPIATKTAIVCNDERITYSELSDRVAKYAGAIAGLGLGPESRLLLFGTDSLDYVTFWLGAVRLGAVPVMISDLYKAKDLAYFLADTAVRLLFIDVEQVPKLLDIASQLPTSLTTILVRGDVSADLAAQFPGRNVVPLHAALSMSTAAVAAHKRHANDLTYMFYSGGTTGTAKGITHLAHDFVLIPERQGRFWEYTVEDVVFATSKKYFTHGLWPGVLIPLYWGATVVLDRRPPTPDVVLATLNERKVSKLITVPTVLKNLIEVLMRAGEPAQFPSLRLVISASEKMPPEMFERFYEITGVEIFDSIGSSEITYEWIANRPKAFKRGSLGRPVFGYTIRLVSADGQDVTEPNVPGEAWVKSRTACFYYWRKYDKSRETFFGDWTRTGDILTFDEDGFFWFSGRNNDLFKVKGLWVSPIEIEAALTRHPAIREAAVVSFEGADGLTKPRAFLVLRENFEQSSALIEEFKQAVAPLGSYKIPASFRFIDQLPRTPLLKIDRKALRD
jgi:benzoate-CoA ligase